MWKIQCTECEFCQYFKTKWIAIKVYFASKYCAQWATIWENPDAVRNIIAFHFEPVKLMPKYLNILNRFEKKNSLIFNRPKENTLTTHICMKLHKHQLLLVILSAWTFPLVYCCTSFRAMAYICAWVLVYMCSVYVYVFSSVRVCLLVCLNIANVEYTCIVTIRWREYKTD